MKNLYFGKRCAKNYFLSSEIEPKYGGGGSIGSSQAWGSRSPAVRISKWELKF